MAPRHRQILLVFVLPLVAASGVMSLLDFRYGASQGAAGAEVATTRAHDAALESPDPQRLLADAAAPAPLDLALPAQSLSAAVLANERRRGGAPEQPLPVPEPTSGLLLALGLAGLAARRRALPRA